APGTEIQARAFERRDEDGKVTDKGTVAEYVASQGATFIHHNVTDSVGSGDRARFEIIHYGTETGVIKSGNVKTLVWPLGPAGAPVRGRARAPRVRAPARAAADGVSARAATSRRR